MQDASLIGNPEYSCYRQAGVPEFRGSSSRIKSRLDDNPMAWSAKLDALYLGFVKSATRRLSKIVLQMVERWFRNEGEAG